MSWTDIPNLWLAIGFGGQLAFSARFLVQWIVSEARRESVIPIPFWYLSLVGGSLLLLYAIHRRDPVFILTVLWQWVTTVKPVENEDLIPIFLANRSPGG